MTRIFRVAKRQWRQLHVPKRDAAPQWDNEKGDYDDEWQSESASSSRSSSGSYNSEEAMLPSATRVKGPARAYDSDRQTRRVCHKRFSFLIIAGLISFFIVLIRLHLSSNRAVSQGVQLTLQKPPWEQFEPLSRYFGGVRTLRLAQTYKPEFPADMDELIASLMSKAGNASTATADHRKRASGTPSRKYIDGHNNLSKQCMINTEVNKTIPTLKIFDGRPERFPSHAIGSYEIFGIQSDICFDRFGRLGPYGLGYSQKHGGTGAGLEGDRDGAEQVWHDESKIDFTSVQWSEALAECQKTLNVDAANPTSEQKSRTAILIRTWADYEYDPEDILHLRSVVNELQMQVCSEYEVHFLIHVQDDGTQIFSDEEVYSQTLREALPVEFEGMGTLWSDRQMSMIYGGLNEETFNGQSVYGNERSTFLPVQHFAHNHPEYDFIWNWEIDVRYIGHFRSLLDRVANWTSAQPRKELWERNGRFYVPSVHGSWEDFMHLVRIQTAHGPSGTATILASLSGEEDLSKSDRFADAVVWGPARSEFDEVADIAEADQPLAAPTGWDKDHYEWGVGETADLVTFNPIFDPVGTTFPPSSDLTGYNVTHYQWPPLRASVGTTVRLSRRLLSAMHKETSTRKHSMAAELWPSSVALHHGYKAVYAPVPMYVERQWPVDYLAAVLNGGKNGASGGARTSVFSVDRRRAGATEEDRLRTALAGTTWSSHGKFAAKLWKRWLGYKVDGEGGEEWELANEGRMCLPSMLLHPVKDVKLIYEDRG